MLKVFGNIYSQNEDDFNVLVRSLEKEGYQVALISKMNGTVIKEVTDLDEEPEIQG